MFRFGDMLKSGGLYYVVDCGVIGAKLTNDHTIFSGQNLDAKGTSCYASAYPMFGCEAFYSILQRASGA